MRYLYPYKCSLTGKQLVLLTIQAYIGVLSFFQKRQNYSLLCIQRIQRKRRESPALTHIDIITCNIGYFNVLL